MGLRSPDRHFEDVADGAEWFDSVALDEVDRAAIGRRNLQALLAL